MRNALAEKPHAPATPPDTSLLGRSFVLGLPDRQGHFHIFLNGMVWRIAAGDYQAGERVQVVGAEADEMKVQRTGALSGSRP